MRINLATFSLLFCLCGNSFCPSFAEDSQSPNSEGHFRHSSKAVLNPVNYGPDQPLWKRYISAGEKFRYSGDQVKAKQYFLAALSELERQKPTKHQITSPIARLERDVLSLYPRVDSKDESDKQLKLDEEALGIMQRIDRLNKVYPNSNDLINQLLHTEYKETKARVDEAKATAAKPSPNKSDESKSN